MNFLYACVLLIEYVLIGKQCYSLVFLSLPQRPVTSDFVDKKTSDHAEPTKVEC